MIILLIFAIILIATSAILYIYIKNKNEKLRAEIKKKQEEELRIKLEIKRQNFIAESILSRINFIKHYEEEKENLNKLHQRNFCNSSEVLDRVNALQIEINSLLETPSEDYESIEIKIQILKQKLENRTKDLYLNLEIEKFVLDYTKEFEQVKTKLQTEIIECVNIIKDLKNKYTIDVFEEFKYNDFLERFNEELKNATISIQKANGCFLNNSYIHAPEFLKEAKIAVKNIEAEFKKLHSLNYAAIASNEFVVKNEIKIEELLNQFKKLCENFDVHDSIKSLKSTLEFSINNLKNMDRRNINRFALKLDDVLNRLKSSIRKADSDIEIAFEKDNKKKFDSEKRRTKNYEGVYDGNYDSLYN